MLSHQSFTHCIAGSRSSSASSPLAVSDFTYGAEQFAHSSCIIQLAGDNVLVTHGGFGALDAKHCRQNLLRAFIIEKG